MNLFGLSQRLSRICLYRRYLSASNLESITYGPDFIRSSSVVGLDRGSASGLATGLAWDPDCRDCRKIRRNLMQGCEKILLLDQLIAGGSTEAETEPMRRSASMPHDPPEQRILCLQGAFCRPAQSASRRPKAPEPRESCREWRKRAGRLVCRSACGSRKKSPFWGWSY